MSFVVATELAKSYPVAGRRLQVLRELSLTVEQGEMVAIMGASGVGKSTLLHLLGGLDRADAGTIRVGEHVITEMAGPDLVAFRNRRVGFVFQFHHLLPEFSAVENAEMPLRIARLPLTEARPRATQLLTRVGLVDRLDHRPGMLSGGEQQRVAVARALVNQPALLLADEPTGDLDEGTADAMHELLRDMHREFGLTAILATHNPRLAEQCDRILRLEGGTLRAS
ncbi:MAG TPA: ABC transporter ATP-binding protein [Vicinamibacterales bacterium]|jgi:lipoprotein-releasing system ATP-binding protein|nr:ABC transporter ATP-binding protein [Vicinamibacterales bacterium]